MLEFIQDSHHYTDSVVKTAAVAVNAGTCLEDANTADNVFSHIGDAISQVCVCVCGGGGACGRVGVCACLRVCVCV